MLHQPEVYPFSRAVELLCKPLDHIPTSIAPESADDFHVLNSMSYSAVAHSGALVLTGIAPADIPAARDRITEALAQDRNTIILGADPIVLDPQYGDIAAVLDRKPKNRQGYANLVFKQSEALSSNFFKEPKRENRWRRILLKPSLTPDAALRCQIMNLVDAHFGDTPQERRWAFLKQLEELVRQPVAMQGGGKGMSVIEPLSGLTFYPVPRDRIGWRDYAKTLPRAGRYRSREPGAFLLDQYSPYHQAGLLYSGHIRYADRELYDAIRMFCRSSQQYADADDFFRRHDILTAADLADPSPGMEGRVRTVIEVNLALSGHKAVLAQASGHATRRLKTRTRLPEPTNS
jgi:hypothetical protein